MRLILNILIFLTLVAVLVGVLAMQSTNRIKEDQITTARAEVRRFQRQVTLQAAGDDDLYGDIFVVTNKSMEVYRRWLALTKPAPGPGGLRRPLWFARSVRPSDETYRL